MRKRTRARRPFTSIVGLALTLLLLAPAGMSSATAATIAAQTPAITANETTAQSTQPFTDVRPGRDFYGEISWMASNGISNGWTVRPGVKEYRPNERVLRDQMAAFMYRLAGSPEFTAPTTSPFTDIRPGQTFYKEIAWLADQGISNGWAGANGTRQFRPGQPVLRDQMAAFMYRLAGSPEFTAPTASRFTDIRPGQTFYKEISWLAESGVSNGWAATGGTRIFGPGRPVLRDQMAAFMYRLDDKGLLERDVPTEEPQQCPADTSCADLTPAPGTIEVPAQSIGNVTVASNTQQIATVRVTDVKVHSGAVLVLAPSPEAPTGAIVRVESVTRSPDGSMLASVSPAKIDEAYTEGVIHVEGDLPTQLPAGPMAGAAATTTTPATDPEAGAEQRYPGEHELECGPESPEAQINSWKVEPNMKPGLDYRWNAFGPELVQASYNGTVDITVDASMSAEGSCTLSTRPFVEEVWVDKVLVTFVFQPSVELTATAAVNATATVTYKCDILYRYTDSNGMEKAQQSCVPSGSKPGIGEDTEASLSVTGAVDAEAALYGVAGVTSQINAGFTASQVPVRDPQGMLTAKLGTKLGLCLGCIFDKVEELEALAEYRKDYPLYEGTLWEKTLVVWSGGPLAPDGEAAPIATLGDEYEHQLAAKGGKPSYTFELLTDVSSYPPGLGLTEDGLIHGAPTQAGTYSFKVVVTDEGLAMTTLNVSIVVEGPVAPLSIGEATLHPTDVGVATERTFFVTGGTKPYTFTRTVGDFPPGMSLDSTTGKLTGKPTQAGEYEFTVKVTDARGRTDTTSSFLVVYGKTAPVITDNLEAISIDSDWGGTFYIRPDGTVGGWQADLWSPSITTVAEDQSVPAQVPGLDNVTQVLSGFNVGFALKSDGTVWSWGNPNEGAMGIGEQPEYIINNLRPQQIPGLTDVVQISEQRYAGYAVKKDGTVWTWGRNSNGRLGIGVTDFSHTEWFPTQIPGLSNIAEVHAGDGQVYALTKDGKVRSWGNNGVGQLGDGTDTLRNAPVLIPGLDNVKSLAAGLGKGYAVKHDGSVWAWGNGIYNPDTSNPIMNYSLVPVPLTTISDVKSVTAHDKMVFVVKNDETVWSWGYSTWPGPLGIGEQNMPDRFVQLKHLSGVETVFAGYEKAFAITENGELWGWGGLGRHYVPDDAPHGMVLEPIRLKK